ncbi:hypothetical protein [Elizabethkingia anophelis]|uniref:hypothetical protein n=1 Tax=Elizabethkingia anophelis TaxID=1117645 RepID=UPI003891A78F|nr:hypothetical protein [Elizabethkingia anophelis]
MYKLKTQGFKGIFYRYRIHATVSIALKPYLVIPESRTRETYWRTYWIGFLSYNKVKIDLSSEDLNDSNTIALRGREEVNYQGKKKNVKHKLPISYA